MSEGFQSRKEKIPNHLYERLWHIDYVITVARVCKLFYILIAADWSSPIIVSDVFAVDF